MQSSERIRFSSSIVFVAIIFISTCSIFLPIEASNVGFSSELIHRDSPLSPLYNPNLTHSERMEKAFQRSLQHNRQIGTLALNPDAGEYLMKIAYGTPPIQSYHIVDTGSALSWIQCLPCINCYPSVTPPFDPARSGTFQHVPCSLRRCLQLNKHRNNSCKPINRPCPYEIKYFDESYSRGNYARDTIIVGSHEKMVQVPNFLFGCGHDNGGNVFPHSGAGLVGFGPEEHSFVSQLRSVLNGKFSHCFAPVTASPGRISFGREAVVSGPGVVSTPLIVGDFYYFATLLGVTVGNDRVAGYFPDTSNNASMVNGPRMVIDTGSQGILLPRSLHMRVDLLVRRKINSRPTTHLPFTLCYPQPLRDADIPKITFHFEGGADLELHPVNTFIERSHLRCLAIVPNDDISVFGSMAMTNFLVVYDIGNRRLSFKPMNCSRY